MDQILYVGPVLGSLETKRNKEELRDQLLLEVVIPVKKKGRVETHHPGIGERGGAAGDGVTRPSDSGNKPS